MRPGAANSARTHDITEEVSQRGSAAPAGGDCHRVNQWLLTLGRLRLHECLDEQVGGLRVEGQGVAQGLQVWTLLQEGFLEAHATRMEVLLWGTGWREVRLAGTPTRASGWAAPTPLSHSTALCCDTPRQGRSSEHPGPAIPSPPPLPQTCLWTPSTLRITPMPCTPPSLLSKSLP